MSDELTDEERNLYNNVFNALDKRYRRNKPADQKIDMLDVLCERLFGEGTTLLELHEELAVQWGLKLEDLADNRRVKAFATKELISIMEDAMIERRIIL